jgi:hypothetical protein
LEILEILKILVCGGGVYGHCIAGMDLRHGCCVVHELVFEYTLPESPVTFLVGRRLMANDTKECPGSWNPFSTVCASGSGATSQ